MDWNGAEVRAQSAVRWPSNADAGGKQTPVGWLLDRVFQTATSSIEAGAPGALRQIRVLAAFACGYDTWTAGYQIATLESRHSSSNLSSLQTVHNLACQFFGANVRARGYFGSEVPTLCTCTCGHQLLLARVIVRRAGLTPSERDRHTSRTREAQPPGTAH
jgi:hypothetical protein